jgi:hypothetical protein
MSGESAEGKRVGAEGTLRTEGEERRLRRRGEREVSGALSEKGLIWELLVAYDRAYFGAVMPLPVGRETIRGAARELGLGLEDFTKARADYEALQERPPSAWDETTAHGVVETFAWLRTQTAKIERLLGVRSPPEGLGGLGAAERADDSGGGGRAAGLAAEEERPLGGRDGWTAAERAEHGAGEGRKSRCNVPLSPHAQRKDNDRKRGCGDERLVALAGGLSTPLPRLRSPGSGRPTLRHL